jgi:hypothetical protein
MSMSNKEITEVSNVRIAIEVSFAVGHMDYGTLSVPEGTPVERRFVNEKWSEWFITNPKVLCPDSFKINGEVSENGFFMHDAKFYGITIPHANVYGSKTCAVKSHKSFHY